MLDPSWSEWFDGLLIQIESENQNQPASLLSGRIADQAHLRGILIKIWDLNLKVISVRLILPADEEPEEQRSMP